MQLAENTVGSMMDHCKKSLENTYDRQETVAVIDRVFKHIIDWRGARLILEKKSRLSESQILQFFKVLKRLQNKEPLQYVLGTVSFFELDLKIDSRALIPRPETEELVDWIINENPKSKKATILDLGTGSGCIALALKKAFPQSNVYGVDKSEKALSLCAENSQIHDLPVEWSQVDLLNATALGLPSKADLIVSNPPYVLESEKISLEQRVRDHEPNMALFVPDNDPLIFYRKILELGKSVLETGGKVYFEIHQSLGVPMLELVEQNGYKEANLRRDISGNDRMIRCTWEG